MQSNASQFSNVVSFLKKAASENNEEIIKSINKFPLHLGYNWLFSSGQCIHTCTEITKVLKWSKKKFTLMNKKIMKTE